MNMSQLLKRNARKFSSKEAFISGEERFTYQEVDEKVTRLANSLRDNGIQAGDHVILFMPNTMEFVYAYFAVQRLDAVIVPINARLTSNELRYIIDHSEAKGFIGHQLLWSQVEPLLNEFSILWITTAHDHAVAKSLNHLIESGSNKDVVSEMKEEDVSTILYTSGTTGKPKGVLLSTKNILTVATMMCIETQINDDSRILHMMPLSHSAPLHLFFAAGNYVGATHVLAPTFTPELLLDLVEKEKVTHFFGAPVAYLLTAKHPRIKETDLTSVVRWVYGGAPLSQPEVAFVKDAFQSDQLMCVYGLTEAGPNGIYLSPSDHEHKAGSIGKRAALNCEFSIVNEFGEEVVPGETGEIVLRGEGNMIGYFKDEIKTNEALKNGWLYTGDMAKQDEEGYIWVVDRKKDVIFTGGVNVFPKEVEDALRDHPLIDDVAVIGVPHPEWGETIKAFVIPTGEIEQIQSEMPLFLQDKLAKYKIPRLYEVISELPRNATGKILKQALREREA